jgi:DNA-binding transcriptional regulator of glucitol operon
VFSGRWLFWHLLTVIVVFACLWLGRWQWERAGEVDGSLQNTGYALQWPLFAVFFLYMWWRMLRMDVRAAHNGEPADRPVERPAPTPAARPAPVTDEEDPELAAYNRMLAELARRDAER